MNIGWREVRTSRTVTRRLCGHVWGGPSGVFDQSNARVRTPISPPAARKSLAKSALILATSLRHLPPTYKRSSPKYNGGGPSRQTEKHVLTSRTICAPWRQAGRLPPAFAAAERRDRAGPDARSHC